MSKTRTGLVPLLLVAAVWAVPLSAGERAFTVATGLRFGGDVDIGEADTSIDLSPVLGLAYDAPLKKPGARWTLYWSRQFAEVDSGDLLTGDRNFDLAVDYLHGGGVYSPAGRGFVFVSVGMTWVDPRQGGFNSDIGVSVAIGGGTHVPLSERLALRFEARGYATLTTITMRGVCGGAACTVEIHGTGALQLEALVGLSIHF
jgi:hypothetical protein